jgi:hemerythrin-like domain-containing protein
VGRRSLQASGKSQKKTRGIYSPQSFAVHRANLLQITDLKKESGALSAATDMCLAHNMFIRMLNCIYLQAPNVKLEKDIADFAIFMHAFLVTVHEHHEGEEKNYFPWLDELNGEVKGYMNKNIEQHHGFAPGLQAFEDYVTSIREGKAKYDSTKLLSLIDVFGTALVEHLNEEVPTFEALDKLEIDWPVWNKKVQKAAVDNAETVSTSSAPWILQILMYMAGV